MSSMRLFQLGLRRAAAPGLRAQPAGRAMVQRRLATSKAEAVEILAKQRLNRPVSPHLTIYKPQITWYGSGLNRLTAVILSGSLYLFGFAYLAAPYTGWHLETQSMVAAVAAWPAAVKVGIKSFFAWPFFYHCINGFRHLAWDMGIGFKNAQVIKTGWTAVALTAISALYYTFAG